MVIYMNMITVYKSFYCSTPLPSIYTIPSFNSFLSSFINDLLCHTSNIYKLLDSYSNLILDKGNNSNHLFFVIQK